MTVTSFSFVMSFFITSLFIVATYFLRKNSVFVLKYGVGTILTIYVCCFFRMLVPIEIPGLQILIEDSTIAPFIFRPLRGDVIDWFIPTALCIWLVVALIKLIILIKDYSKLRKNIFSCLISKEETELGTVIISSFLSTPVTIGAIKPVIVLPNEKCIKHIEKVHSEFLVPKRTV